MAALDRHFKNEQGYKFSIIRDREFHSSKQVLEGKARQLRQSGVIADLNPRSKSASENGPPGNPIPIWTPFADLDLISHIKYRDNFTFQSWRRNVSFSFQNSANLFINRGRVRLESNKLTVCIRHTDRPLKVADKARAAAFRI